MASIITADTGAVSGTAGLKQSADSSGILALATGTGTTAVTIDASQNVGIATGAPTAKLTITNGANANRALYVEGYPTSLPTSTFYRDNTDAQYVITIRHDNAVSASTGYMLQFLNQGGTGVGSITSTGTATAYNTSSDYRLKENVAPMTGALEKVAALKPVTYTWKVDGSEGEGFIAHELAEVCPHAVTGEKDAVETYVDDEGNEQTRPVYQGIDVSFLVGTLTAAIQEQQALITTLTERISALEAK